MAPPGNSSSSSSSSSLEDLQKLGLSALLRRCDEEGIDVPTGVETKQQIIRLLRPDLFRPAVHLFIDDSNIWASAKNLHTATSQLLDLDGVDKRVRYSLGSILDEVATHHPEVDMVGWLYGSRPPPNDSVWKAARKQGFQLNLSEKQLGPDGRYREKEVDVAIATQIENVTTTYHRNGTADLLTIVLFTGDRDFYRLCQSTIEKGIRLELWAFSASLSTAYLQLANVSPLVTLHNLDRVRGLTYLSFRSTNSRGLLAKEKAVVFQTPLARKEGFYRAITDLLISCQFYFFVSEQDTADTTVLIAEFPSLRPDRISVYLDRIEASGLPEGVTATPYVVFTSRVTLREQATVTSNRYLPLQTGDDDGEDESQEEDQDRAEQEDTSPEVQDDEAPEEDALDLTAEPGDAGEWKVSISKRRSKLKPGRVLSQARLQRDAECPHGFRCQRGVTCKQMHSRIQEQFFAHHQGKGLLNYRTAECRHPNPRHPKQLCAFAHEPSEAYCLNCKGFYSHFTATCPHPARQHPGRR